MPNDATKLITNSAKWTGGNGISVKEQKCLILDAWTKALANLPGQANYALTSQPTNASALGVQNWLNIFPAMGSNINSMTPDQVRAATVQTVQQQAMLDIASFNVLRVHSQYLMRLPEDQIDRCIVYTMSAFLEYIFTLL